MQTIKYNSYKCPRCFRVSYHPKDIEHRYCGACHRFEGDDELIQRIERAAEIVKNLGKDKP